jgi:hypothetical protein
MKHVLKMTVILLAMICATAQSPKPATQPAKPATANTVHKPAAVSPAAVKPEKASAPFEVVSAKRVDSVRGVAGSSVSWAKDDVKTGLIVVLKRKSPGTTFMLHSADFSLHTDEDNTIDTFPIPASPVIGASGGMKTPDENTTWLLGVVSATKIDEGDAYIALLFEAHKKYQQFSLHYATPLANGIKVAAQ